MTSLLLYSTNPYMKYYIQKRFRGDIHYVWCSESFDSTALAKLTPAALVPPTSNPKDIYLDLKGAVAKVDTHNAKIKEQIAGMTARAIQWESNGEITSDEKDEIIYMVNEPRYFSFWRPLLYVIPANSLGTRAKPVPAHRRAGLGPEYIIEDLAGHE